MEIKKFEAYTYKGPTLKSINRKKFVEQIIDILSGENKICDYETSGSMYDLNGEVLYLFGDKKVGDKYVDNIVIKLDLSDMGIEIGSMEWSDDKEEFEDFIPEINLDSDITKQVKDYKTNIKKFNI